MLLWLFFTLNRYIYLFTFMLLKKIDFSGFLTLCLPIFQALLCFCHCTINAFIYPPVCWCMGAIYWWPWKCRVLLYFLFQVFQVYHLQWTKSIPSVQTYCNYNLYFLSFVCGDKSLIIPMSLSCTFVLCLLLFISKIFKVPLMVSQRQNKVYAAQDSHFSQILKLFLLEISPMERYVTATHYWSSSCSINLFNLASACP